MKTIWDWLEIDCTTDKQAIKKAYANQAKKYHPEENPEEFKQLRNAYKTAMKYASSSIARQPFVVVDETAADVKEPEGEERGNAGAAKGLEVGEDEEIGAGKEPEYTYSLVRNGGKDESKGRRPRDRQQQDERSQEGSGEAKENEEDNRYIYSLTANGSNEKDKGKKPQDRQLQDRQPQSRQHQERQQSRQHQDEPQSGQPQDWQEQHFVYNQGNQGNFGFEMQQRLLDFLRRIDIIYVDNSMCNNIKAWKMLFRYYECKDDFNNHDFVAAVVDAFEKMPGINKKIRTYIGRQLFASNDNDVTIKYLKERYYDQQSYTIKANPQQQQKSPQMRDIARKLYGRQNKAYKRYNFINNCVSMICVCVFGILLAYAYKMSNYEDNKNEKPQMTISTKFLCETQGEIVVLEKLDVYKREYTKDTPFTSDVNGDGYADRVYYDSDADRFLVEEYNPETSDYIQAGNVNDYCRKNIKARVKLFRFLQEDK